jgi:chaperonin cofactor prefoldin
MKSLIKYLIWFCLAMALFLGVCWNPVEASPRLLDPRINRLESQVRSLQSQVTRLQGQIPRVSNGRTAPPSIAPEESSLDQQFDTLAILIIELQERVSVLETRLDATEESLE